MPPIGSANQLNLLGIPTQDPTITLPVQNEPINPATGQQAPLNPNVTAPTTAPTVDPYAKYGGQAAYNNLSTMFGNQKQNLYATAGDAANNYGAGLKNNILNYIDTLKASQQKIDNQAIQDRLAKTQGYHSILDMVGQGIRSGGVQLGQKNASDSSAAEGLARAYGVLGNRQASQVGNQFAQAENANSQAQTNLDTQTQGAIRNFNLDKTQHINDIVTQARSALAQLDAQMAYASMPDRINIQQEQENIRQNALGALQQYDQQIAGLATAAPASSDQARTTEAMRLSQAGTAPDQGFQINTALPAQFQQSGPFNSPLPLFTLPTAKKTV